MIPLFTVALPVFNEDAILDRLHGLLTVACSQVTDNYEILYIDDGSKDGTPRILDRIAAEDQHVSVIALSRNFGHQPALAAAITFASGRSLILMDADLQDHPSVIPQLIEAQQQQDAEVVYVVRSARQEGAFITPFFNLFHWLVARTSTFPVPRDAGSFGLIGPRALAEVRRLTEKLRYFPGLRSFVGFKQVPIAVERGQRYDKQSRVGFWGLIRLAGLALFAETRVPVTIFYVISFCSLILGMGLMAYALIAKAMGVAVVAWTSTVTSIALFSSIIILGQAFICEYLARIYEEVRGRPVFIADRILRARRWSVASADHAELKRASGSGV